MNIGMGEDFNKIINVANRLSSTIAGNVEFVHSQYNCILTSQLSIHFMCPTKLLIIVIVLQ